jgi:hypothetical protein
MKRCPRKFRDDRLAPTAPQSLPREVRAYAELPQPAQRPVRIASFSAVFVPDAPRAHRKNRRSARRPAII